MKDRKTELAEFLKENEDQARQVLAEMDYKGCRVLARKAKLSGLFVMTAKETEVAQRLRNIATKHIGWRL